MSKYNTVEGNGQRNGSFMENKRKKRQSQNNSSSETKNDTLPFKIRYGKHKKYNRTEFYERLGQPK